MGKMGLLTSILAALRDSQTDYLLPVIVFSTEDPEHRPVALDGPELPGI